MLSGANTAKGAIVIKAVVVGVLTKCRLSGNAARGSQIKLTHLIITAIGDVMGVRQRADGLFHDGGAVFVQQVGFFEFTQNRHDTAGAMKILHMKMGAGSDFTHIGNDA